MAIGRPVQSIKLNHDVIEHLKAINLSRTMPYGLLKRVKIILMAAEGYTNKSIAESVELSEAVIGMWRKRFLTQGLVGLYDEAKPGGPRSITDQQIGRKTPSVIEVIA